MEALDERTLFHITGKRCGESYVLPKLLWFRENEPRLYARCHKILMPQDFLLARLTGEPATDHTMASGSLLYDITSQGWSARLLELFGVDPAILPIIRRSGSPAGRLREDAAQALGLSPDTLVAVGGQDQKVAALGAGLDLRRTTVSLGTAMAIAQQSNRPLLDGEMRIPCFTDLLPGRWVLEGSSVCGSILDWLQRTVFPSASLEEMDRLAAKEEENREPLLFYPYFAGAASPHFLPEARGFLYGLNLSTSPGQLVRGVLEGIAFEILENLQVMESISRPAHELRVFGGGASSETWCRIIAEVTGKPVAVLDTNEAAATGAAILAGLAVGVFGTVEQAFEHVRLRDIYQPREAAVERYRELHGRYRDFARRIYREAGP
jgi:sugar (pentulose or hexulose) kinase